MEGLAISELLMFHIFDRLDKQIAKKIPYSLLISFTIYLMADIKCLLAPLLTASIVTFPFSTVLLNITLNRAIEGVFTNVDFKKLVEKFANIFEGKASLLGDLKAQENKKVLTLGILSGVSLTILMSSAFFTILNYFNVGRELIVSAMVFLFIYAYQDLAGADLLREYQARGGTAEAPIIQDIAETYLIDNSLKKLPSKTLSIVMLKFLDRTIGPLCHLTAPRLQSHVLLIYKNNDVVSFIEKLARRSESPYLKHEQGMSVDSLFAEGLGRTPSIAYLKEKSLKENFPYLFDPNYSYQEEKDQRKWAALSIIGGNKVKGYLFIHVFKGVQLKTRLGQDSRRPTKRIPQRREVLLLILFGERRYVEYLKTQIEVLSVKYPQSLIDVEIE